MDIEKALENTENKERMDRLSRRGNTARLDSGYSRFVRMMRLALPLSAMGVFVVLYINPGAQDKLIAPVQPNKTEFTEESIRQNELINPKFESIDKKSQPYKITADRAVQGSKNKDLIMLEHPVGVMTMQDGVRVTMRSDSGAYRQDSERFFLQGGVFLDHDQGYSLKSEEAHIDMRQNFAWSEKDVQGRGPDLSIDAKGVHANGNTGEIVFTGPAKLVLEDGFGGAGK